MATDDVVNDTKNAKVCEIYNIMDKFGVYQQVQYLLICLCVFSTTMSSLNYVFVVGDVDYRCRVPECEEANSTEMHPEWWPRDEAVGRCHRPVLATPNYTSEECFNTSFSSELEECTSWVYENMNTVVAELNLACEPWRVSLVGTIHNVGMLISMVTSGMMADRFGRKPTLVFCAVAGVIGNIKTFITSYNVYLAFELLEAALCGGTYASGMVLMIEIGGKKHRVLAGVLFAYSIYMGETVFAFLAMMVPYWKHLVRVIYCPMVIFSTYVVLIRESPRWLVLNGKEDAAKKTFLHVAKVNKLNVNHKDIAEMNKDNLKEMFNIGAEQNLGYIEIFSSKELLKRLLVASSSRFTASFVYYGLMMNSVSLPGDKYINFMLTTLMSFPGEIVAMYLMNKFGRKAPLIIGFLFCGAVCISSAYVPHDFPWVKIGLFMLGKMIISICFTGSVTYSMELYPTSARGLLLGLSAFSSCVGAMVAPLTPIVYAVSPVVLSLLFAGSTVVTALLITTTPETKSLPLMDTLQQINEHKNNVKAMRNKNKAEGHDNPAYSNDITAL